MERGGKGWLRRLSNRQGTSSRGIVFKDIQNNSSVYLCFPSTVSDIYAESDEAFASEGILFPSLLSPCYLLCSDI